MQSVGQSWLVLELTGSAFLLGLIGTLQFGPVLLLSFVGGALSDRVPKRRVILLTQTALMVQAVILAVLAWTGHVRYWHVAVLALVYGVANALDMPARQSYVADLVGRDDLMNAVALNSAVFNSARVVGPAVAGLIISRWGAAVAFGLNALSFVAVLIALLAIRNQGGVRAAKGAGLMSELGEAVRYAITTPAVAFVLSALMSMSLLVINFTVIVPLLARDALGEGAHGFGLLMAALGAGAVAGALLAASLALPRPPLALVVGPAIVLSVATIALGLAPSFRVAVPILVVIGFCQILFMTSCNTTLQVAAPDRLRGRVMGLYALGFAGITPFGSFLVGSVAAVFGIRVACVAGGGAGIAAVLALAGLWRWRTAANPA